MKPFLLIDGYNLMHAAGVARRRYGPGDLERCRKQLNRQLRELLSPETLARTAIVYDAFTSESNDRRSTDEGGLRVLFAPKGTDADSEIERLLNQTSAPRQTLVVSSDHRLHKAARRRKASCVDSEDFWEEITQPLTVSPLPNASLPAPPSSDDTSRLQSWANKEQAESEPVAGSEFDASYMQELEDELNGQ